MNESKNEWKNEWMNEWMNEWKNEWEYIVTAFLKKKSRILHNQPTNRQMDMTSYRDARVHLII